MSSDNIPLIILVATAMVALVVAIRLFSVLGRRTGNEGNPDEAFQRLRRRWSVAAPPQAPAQPAKPTVAAAPALVRQPGLFDIQLADKSFDTQNFLAGARQAYELIVTAFARGDRIALRPLLSDEVYGAFDAAIRDRQAKGETGDFSFGGVRESRIDTAALKDNRAEITVAFHAQSTSDGTMRDVNDHWTFARDVTSSDPNWILVATGGPETL